MSLLWIFSTLIQYYLRNAITCNVIIVSKLPIAGNTIEVKLHCVVQWVSIRTLISRIWFLYFEVFHRPNKWCCIIFPISWCITWLSFYRLSTQNSLIKRLLNCKLRFLAALLSLSSWWICFNLPTSSIRQQYLWDSLPWGSINASFSFSASITS